MDLNNRPVWLLPLIATILAGGLATLLLTVSPRAETDNAGVRAAPVRTSGEAQIGGPFTLVNHLGETVTEADFRGRPMLIYFGFTYCPDICPMSLQVMDAALARLPEAERAVFQPVLISVDSERDTPEALADYVGSPAFPDGLIGLTGSEDQIREAARVYRVYYRRIEDDGTLAAYTMDHTSLIYLMDSEGNFVEVFPHGADPAHIASRLQQFLEEQSGQS